MGGPGRDMQDSARDLWCRGVVFRWGQGFEVRIQGRGEKQGCLAIQHHGTTEFVGLQFQNGLNGINGTGRVNQKSNLCVTVVVSTAATQGMDVVDNSGAALGGGNISRQGLEFGRQGFDMLGRNGS